MVIIRHTGFSLKTDYDFLFMVKLDVTVIDMTHYQLLFKVGNHTGD